jgi:hypothetical protein
MTTDLTLINQQELDAFIAATRASQEDLSGGGDFLPQLKVNYQDEIEWNGAKKEIKPGLFTLSNQEVPSFAKNVVFRPLLHTYQYIKYNKEEDKVVCRSILFNDFTDEPRDEDGTLRCGKPPSKVLRDNPALKKQYEDTNLYRSVDGLVSYEGTDPDGNKVSVNNVLCTFRGKGSNFSPFNDEYIKLMPRGSVLWDYALVLSVTKHKQDPKSAVSYYVVHFDANFSDKLPFNVELFDTVKELKRRIDETNKEIDKKYYAAFEAAKDSKIIDVAASLVEDLQDDEIPF